MNKNETLAEASHEQANLQSALEKSQRRSDSNIKRFTEAKYDLTTVRKQETETSALLEQAKNKLRDKEDRKNRMQNKASQVTSFAL